MPSRERVAMKSRAKLYPERAETLRAGDSAAAGPGARDGRVPLNDMDQARKISTVAAASASDVNDCLTMILSAASAAMKVTQPGHPARIYLLDIIQATAKAGFDTAFLLDFSHRNGAKPSPASAAALTSTL